MSAKRSSALSPHASRARRVRRTLGTASVALTLPLLLAACGEEAQAPGEGSVPIVSAGTLGPAAGPGPARTYNPALAPVGATMRAELLPFAGGTQATLTVDGLLPNRSYAAHGHVNPCGPTGEAAGPHYQDMPDPAALPFSPSVDPTYANPSNEYWLDVRTDAAGAGTDQTSVPFPISVRGPYSIVLHEGMTTLTAPGVAGTAGGRIACLTLAPIIDPPGA